nr:hypothetical protein [uncultured Carboxylicivirga sp.]
MTRIEISSIISGHKTIFTNGYYSENSEPDIYMRPEYRGFTSGFQLIVFWEDEKCNVVSYLDNFELKNTNDNFEFIQIDIDLFMKMKNDTTGKYNYQIEPKIKF